MHATTHRAISHAPVTHSAELFEEELVDGQSLDQCPRDVDEWRRTDLHQPVHECNQSEKLQTNSIHTRINRIAAAGNSPKGTIWSEIINKLDRGDDAVSRTRQDTARSTSLLQDTSIARNCERPCTPEESLQEAFVVSQGIPWSLPCQIFVPRLPFFNRLKNAHVHHTTTAQKERVMG